MEELDSGVAGRTSTRWRMREKICYQFGNPERMGERSRIQGLLGIDGAY
jgi:hypothetical protein